MEPLDVLKLLLIFLGVIAMHKLLTKATGAESGLPQKPCHTIKQIHKWTPTQVDDHFGGKVWVSVCDKCKLRADQIT